MARFVSERKMDEEAYPKCKRIDHKTAQPNWLLIHVVPHSALLLSCTCISLHMQTILFIYIEMMRWKMCSAFFYTVADFTKVEGGLSITWSRIASRKSIEGNDF